MNFFATIQTKIIPTLVLFLVCASILFSQLQQYGLEGKRITSFATYANYGKSPIVFASTDTSGIFYANSSKEIPAWISFGLSGKSINALTLQTWGVGPIYGETLFAATDIDKQRKDSTLIMKRVLGFVQLIDSSWIKYDNGIKRESLKQILAMNCGNYGGHEPPKSIIAGGKYGVYYNYDYTSWQISNIPDSNKINSIDVYPRFFSYLVWAAGSSGSHPALFESNDMAISWKTFVISFTSVGEIFSVAINPTNTYQVFYCGAGVVCSATEDRTVDTLLVSPGTKFTSVVVDASSPNYVFAGGIGASNSFVLYCSADLGKSWHSISKKPTDSIASISSLALIKDENTGDRYLLIGTNGTGVWRYKFNPITKVEKQDYLPFDFSLSQNYPNPFNPTTTIKFSIPSLEQNPISASKVVLKVYDILGRTVATLANEEKPPGDYEVKFDGNNLPSGVYFYRLQYGSFQQTKKLVLMK